MSSGIVRRIDELGRIVIPKEIRKKLRIKNGDNLSIELNDENIVLNKYSQIDTLSDIVYGYVNAFYNVLKYNIIVTDTDKVIAARGNLEKKYLDLTISDKIIGIMEHRDCYVERKKSNIEIVNDFTECGYYAVATIINNGDSIGCVIILSLDSPMLEQEEKLAKILADMLSSYFL